MKFGCYQRSDALYRKRISKGLLSAQTSKEVLRKDAGDEVIAPENRWL